MRLFWIIFEKLRYMVYAFCFAMFVGISVGIEAGQIDRNAVHAWVESRIYSAASYPPVSNILHREAIARYERRTEEQFEQQNTGGGSSLSALKERQKLDALRAEKERLQEIMDRSSQ